MSDSNNRSRDGDHVWMRIKFGPFSTRLAVLMRHRNTRALFRFVIILTSLVTSYSVLFQLLMADLAFAALSGWLFVPSNMHAGAVNMAEWADVSIFHAGAVAIYVY